MITRGMATDRILGDEGQALASVVATFIRTVEIGDLEVRLGKLEEANTVDQPAVRFDA
jgi:hypothetical protein